MILSPFLPIKFYPNLYSSIRRIRSLRPLIKIGKDRFQISIDVHQFKREEICVKAVPEYVIIEGKLERKSKSGQVVRQFVRKFKLPDGCSPSTMKSELSSDGILTITAPRKPYDANLPQETLIPTSYSERRTNTDGPFIPVEGCESNKVCNDKREGKKDN
ncbi:unnamed protein product [Parnassius apollo]|uniref:(apollo) hypothetical protein n=1 Tax=Parnassius apollo TaxID=110799 RepID=A0A8S3XUI3_PARAO|nr:unnamed protein product [Parnassius apollo]